MDIWALSAALKYAPAKSTIRSTSKYVLTELWKDVAAHYNGYLKNMVGRMSLPMKYPSTNVFGANDPKHTTVHIQGI